MMEKKQQPASATPRTASIHAPTSPSSENEGLYRTRWIAIQAAFRESRGLTPAQPRGARNPGIFR
jgi:hypothetical protein